MLTTSSENPENRLLRRRTDYIDRLMTIRQTLEKERGSSALWLLAKSTLHPTVHNDALHGTQIRAASASLWKMPGLFPGPDTDIPGGQHRCGHVSRHFSALGQKTAGLMRFAAILSGLFDEGPHVP
jgi:hypothetical protein